MRFELTLLGVNSALPAYGRHPSAQVLNVQEQLFLIDCGEGTQMRMSAFNIRKSRIRQVFISHLHGDHVYGLIGLLTSYALNGRKAPMDLFSPPGLEEIIEVQLRNSGGGLSFPLRFHPIETGNFQLIFENAKLKVFSFPLVHRIPTAGFLFREKKKPRNIISEKIAQFGIHYSDIPAIKQGDDLLLPDGRRIPNAELTTDSPSPRSFAYCSDTLYSEAVLPFIKGVDLLYHEATFCEDHLPQTEVSMHSTARQAALIAQKAEVGKLILGHYSSRYPDLDCFEKEAKAVFPNTVLGQEGAVYRVGFREGE